MSDPEALIESFNERSERLQPLFDRMDAFGSLPTGWDSYRARSITRTTIAAARRLLLALDASFAQRGAEMTVPFIAPLPNGNIQFEWDAEEVSLELEVNERGRILALRTDETNPMKQSERAR